MVKWSLWSFVLILTTLSVSSSTLQSGLGMQAESRPKRRPTDAEDDRQMVTIDLSALRPSLPGLVLYKYGEVAPKLVQVDLSALNPQLQPHVIWPQFEQMDFLNDRSFDFDSLDAIPYLTDEETLMTPNHQRVAMMSMNDAESWPEMGGLSDSDIYDFIPDSRRNDELMSLQGSLPLADEVIVPLDWEEEKVNRNSANAKRNVFMATEWPAGRQKGGETVKQSSPFHSNVGKAPQGSYNVHYTPFGATNRMPGKRKQGRETESEERDDTNKLTVGQMGKRYVFMSSGWGAAGQQASMAGVRRHEAGRSLDNKPQSQPVRISSQESWSVPRQYWNVPHLLGSHGQ